jgi:hypothetical protein
MRLNKSLRKNVINKRLFMSCFEMVANKTDKCLRVVVVRVEAKKNNL